MVTEMGEEMVVMVVQVVAGWQAMAASSLTCLQDEPSPLAGWNGQHTTRQGGGPRVPSGGHVAG